MSNCGICGGSIGIEMYNVLKLVVLMSFLMVSFSVLLFMVENVLNIFGFLLLKVRKVILVVFLFSFRYVVIVDKLG